MSKIFEYNTQLFELSCEIAKLQEEFLNNAFGLNCREVGTVDSNNAKFIKSQQQKARNITNILSKKYKEFKKLSIACSKETHSNKDGNVSVSNE